ncbi:hypothetical protein [Arenibaculum pallidiluteum]|uniref:hypothetical protein n=1 Tax=Arenibaculum pallidiluteum TaxID=2812559 RepID=UPI001A96AA61|nr:hypothetical protein [Arenibaculum pallidiluteum]
MTGWADTAGGAASGALRLERGARLLPWGAAIVLLALAGVAAKDFANPDGVAYARLALYWSEGRWALAVTGYWGQLLPWLAAPLLRLGLDPVVAMRVAMGLSGLVFLHGAGALLAAFRLPPAELRAGFWIAALLAAVWSIVAVTPDLLAAGLLLAGMARLVDEDMDARCGLQAGVLFGFAYLAKAVMLPTAVLAVGCVQGLRWWLGRAGLTASLRCALAAGLGLGAVALPWILALSLHYGAPTFSTSGAPNHAIAGPPDRDRGHPTFRIHHEPPPGRLTTWEDPTIFPYEDWSPFESAAHLRHQAGLVAGNAKEVLRRLARFDMAGLGLAAAVFAALGLGRAGWRAQPWRLALPLSSCVAAAYLPVYAGDDRYFVASIPILLGAALGLSHAVGSSLGPVRRWLPAALVAASFAVPAADQAAFMVLGRKHAHLEAARPAAAALGTGVRGVASVRDGTHFGLYLAWMADVPFLGNSDAAAVPADLNADQAAVRADVFVLGRDSPMAAAMTEDAAFERVTAGGGEKAWPAAVFRRRSPTNFPEATGP